MKSGHKKSAELNRRILWRSEGDSNSRTGNRSNDLANRPLQPLEYRSIQLTLVNIHYIYRYCQVINSSFKKEYEPQVILSQVTTNENVPVMV